MSSKLIHVRENVWAREDGSEVILNPDGTVAGYVVGKFVVASDGKLFQRDCITGKLIPLSTVHEPASDM